MSQMTSAEDLDPEPPADGGGKPPWLEAPVLPGVLEPRLSEYEIGRSVSANSVFKRHRPSMSMMELPKVRPGRSFSTLGPSYLDKVLGHEFVGAMRQNTVESELTSDDPGSPHMSPRREESVATLFRRQTLNSLASRATLGSRFTIMSGGLRLEFADLRSLSLRVVEQRWFTGLFMLFTFYALYVPDLDMWLGNKESRYAFSIVTTVVCGFFLLEIILMTVAKTSFVCSPYFWLDIVCFVSLLPDTYLMQAVSSNDAFVAGRSSRITRLLLVTTRSSRAARLNRVTRLVRVAALMPRVHNFFSRQIKDVDTERLRDKKLQRIFHFLDEDMDGFISRHAADRCLAKLRMLTSKDQTLSKSLTWAQQAASRMLPTHPSSRSFSIQTKTSDRSTVGSPLNKAEGGSPDNSKPSTPTGSPVMLPSPDEWRPSNTEDQVSLDRFRAMVAEDAVVCLSLRRACQAQIQQSNNVISMTARNSEYVGVKIALGVLLLIFLLSLIASSSEELSGEYGLNSIDRLVSQYSYNRSSGAPVPLLIQDQVRQWTKGGEDWRQTERDLLYLDLNKRVYCNDFVSPEPHCTAFNHPALAWSPRVSMSAIDGDVQDSDYRIVDLVLLRVPDFSSEDISAEDLEQRTTAVAVINDRSGVQSEAQKSVLATSLVMFVIFVGIGLLASDFTLLARRLFKPLVELADEMESASRLQLAGFSLAEEDTQHERTDILEIRMIRRTFDNMKKAIKSWGKYVPWQVVQALLRKDVEVDKVDVKEMEVSIFFSDIASFTTIVESLEPERSLLLLSRYFHDMSMIIDEYGGAVLDYIGDAILAIYGAPASTEDHPTTAVKAAVEMLDQLLWMNQWFVEKGLPEVSIRAGVHTGRVLVGNMGFRSRMKYGVIGEDSEMPSHLEEINKTYATKLLISNDTFKRLAPNAFITRPIDYVCLGESGESQLIHEVIQRFGEDKRSEHIKNACAAHTSGMTSYINRDFDKAVQHFKKSNDMMKKVQPNKEDIPSGMLLKRCTDYMRQPPPAEWDGVWDNARDGQIECKSV